jgi:L-rhamnose isomerase
MTAYDRARSTYLDWGVNADSAIEQALQIPISIHCWQSDDVGGFEVHDGAVDSGGIMATGNYPGKATSPDQVRQDYEQVLALVPGVHRANLHAIYAETGGKAVARDEISIEHFQTWVEWALSRGIALDFNPTYFAHPLAADGFTLSSARRDVRDYWTRHGIRCRQIAGEMATRFGGECVNNHWIPDGAKDSPADRWSPRARLIESFDAIFGEPIPGCTDSVESKLFGLGSEDYVVGSFEFYAGYAQSRKKLFCLDMGHFHPTETIADKLSALLQFHDRLLLHVSRPVRWDSDHVVLFNEDLKNVFLELQRGGAMQRVAVALDYFDASINRIAAYVIGIRATRKAILNALLDPVVQLQEAERAGKLGKKLALMEEARTLPFGDVWDELCRRGDVPVGREWIKDVERYEAEILATR